MWSNLSKSSKMMSKVSSPFPLLHPSLCLHPILLAPEQNGCNVGKYFWKVSLRKGASKSSFGTYMFVHIEQKMKTTNIQTGFTEFFLFFNNNKHYCMYSVVYLWMWWQNQLFRINDVSNPYLCMFCLQQYWQYRKRAHLSNLVNSLSSQNFKNLDIFIIYW